MPQKVHKAPTKHFMEVEGEILGLTQDLSNKEFKLLLNRLEVTRFGLPKIQSPPAPPSNDEGKKAKGKKGKSKGEPPARNPHRHGIVFHDTVEAIQKCVQALRTDGISEADKKLRLQELENLKQFKKDILQGNAPAGGASSSSVRKGGAGRGAPK